MTSLLTAHFVDRLTERSLRGRIEYANEGEASQSEWSEAQLKLEADGGQEATEQAATCTERINTFGQ